MNAQELIHSIFEKKLVFDEQGNSYPLNNSAVRPEEGAFLKNIIEQYHFANTIEIGCAYGISSLFICAALGQQSHPHHTIIDPSQQSVWKNIGVSNLKRAGIPFFQLIEKPSEIALPCLLAEGKKFELGFIDGWHTFDHTLIDFFYLNRLIEPGGIIIIDDIDLPPVNKMIRYVLNYPAYRPVGHVSISASVKRKIFDSFIKAPFRLISGLMPEKIRYEIFSGKTIKTDEALNLNSSMIALQKTGPDERSWDWFKDF